MRLTLMVLAVVIGAASGGAALAAQASEPAAATPDPQAKPSKPDKSKRVCKNIVMSGTRLSQRHCRSQADWEGDREYQRRLVEKGQTDDYRRDGENNTYQTGVSVPPH